ncbi:MAG: hypothetical protein ABL932_17380 [Terricaulis sp.]
MGTALMFIPAVFFDDLTLDMQAGLAGNAFSLMGAAFYAGRPALTAAQARKRIWLPFYETNLADIYARLARLSDNRRMSRGRLWACVSFILGATLVVVGIVAPHDWRYDEIYNSTRNALPAFFRSLPTLGSGMPEALTGIALVLNAVRLWNNRGGVIRGGIGLALFWIALPAVAIFCVLVPGFLAALLVQYLFPAEHITNGNMTPSQTAKFWLAGVAGMAFAIRWVERAPRFLAVLDNPNPQQERSRDQRAPVLYLRSFGDETHNNYGGESMLERAISGEARRIGPFVAIGRPGTWRVYGAARAYYDGDRWREAVQSWMGQARLIVMIAGWTQGLVWELQTVLSSGHSHKLALLFPRSGDPHHEARCDWVRACLRNTEHGPLLERADLSRALALHLLPGPRLIVVSGDHELEQAFVLAAFGVLSRPTSWGAPS